MLKILIIEDDVVDQMALSRFFKKELGCCDLEIMESIQSASAALKDHFYDFVICDINLPDGTAFDLADFFTEQTFILLSGQVNPKILEKAASAGVQAVLQKSSDLSQLQQLLKQMNHESSGSPKSDNIPTSRLEKLLSIFDNDRAYVREMIQIFLQENRKMLQDLLKAQKDKNRNHIMKIAHKLKSGYMVLSLKHQEKLAQEIETLAPDAQINLNSYIQELYQTTLETYNELQLDLERLAET